MKIAFLVDEFPSLSETFILNQITGLLERGHDVHIIAWSRGAKNEVIQPEIGAYQLLRRTRYIAVPRSKAVRSLKGLLIVATHVLGHHKAICGALDFVKFGVDALSLRLLYGVIHFLDHYDIVHCQFGPNGNFGAVLKKIGLQDKLMVTFHGYDIRQGISGKENYRAIAEEADCILAISDYNRVSMRQFGFADSRVTVHPVGIDCAKFAYVERDYDRKRPIKLVSIGRLVREKGFAFSIHAVHQVVSQYPNRNLEYNIIGEGPLRGELQALIESLGLHRIVHLVGAQPQNQVITSLKESDIYVLASLAEALPVVLMEAAATGLPVIATRVGGVEQLVVDGRSGCLVPPGNVEALAQTLKMVICNWQRWPEMGRVGREHIAQHYDIEMLNDRLVSLYRQVLQLQSVDRDVPKTYS